MGVRDPDLTSGPASEDVDEEGDGVIDGVGKYPKLREPESSVLDFKY